MQQNRLLAASRVRNVFFKLDCVRACAKRYRHSLVSSNQRPATALATRHQCFVETLRTNTSCSPERLVSLSYSTNIKERRIPPSARDRLIKSVEKELFQAVKEQNRTAVDNILKTISNQKLKTTAAMLNNLISYYSRTDPEIALNYYRILKGRDLLPEDRVYTSLITACARTNPPQSNRALKFMDEMEAYRIPINIYHYNALMQVFAVTGDAQSALEVFDKLSSPRSNCTPDKHTCTSFLVAIKNYADIRFASKVLVWMRKHDVPIDSYVVTAFLNICEVAMRRSNNKHGELTEEEIEQPEIFSSREILQFSKTVVETLLKENYTPHNKVIRLMLHIGNNIKDPSSLSTKEIESYLELVNGMSQEYGIITRGVPDSYYLGICAMFNLRRRAIERLDVMEDNKTSLTVSYLLRGNPKGWKLQEATKILCALGQEDLSASQSGRKLDDNIVALYIQRLTSMASREKSKEGRLNLEQLASSVLILRDKLFKHKDHGPQNDSLKQAVRRLAVQQPIAGKSWLKLRSFTTEATS
eukprot:m.46054 g.46054  ORF g.46054 m.46054 type:complete len:529 (-) comp10330_c0_seq2:84-1670(-)